MQEGTQQERRLPSNTMIELGLKEIGDGDFVQEMGDRLKEGHEALKKHFAKTQSRKGKVTITGRITMAYDPKIDGMVSIEHIVEIKVPKHNRATLVKEKDGRLLVRPDGSPDIEQMRLFDDLSGKPLGVYDPSTGEIKAEKVPAVAGKIG